MQERLSCGESNTSTVSVNVHLVCHGALSSLNLSSNYPLSRCSRLSFMKQIASSHKPAFRTFRRYYSLMLHFTVTFTAPRRVSILDKVENE